MVGGFGRGVYVLLVVIRGAARPPIAPSRVSVSLPVSLPPVSVPVPLSLSHWRRLVQGARGGHVWVRGHVHPSGASVVIRGVTGKRRRRNPSTSVVHRGVLRRNSMRLVVIARLEPGRGRHGRRRAGGGREHVLRRETSSHWTAAVTSMPEKTVNLFRELAPSSKF